MKSDALKLKAYAAEQENTDALRIAYSDATWGRICIFPAR